jgi:hypothetical protein
MNVPDRSHDFEAPDAWDWDRAGARPGLSGLTVTVSIKLTSSEFDAIAACAEREGTTVTEFLKKLALDAARRRSPAP